MTFRTLRSLGMALLVGSGLIHLIIVPDALYDHPAAQYINVLFVINFVGTLVAAFGMRRKTMTWGWLLGVVISAGSIIGYVLSRTIGLPGVGIESWVIPIGLFSLVCEGGFIIVTFLVWPHIDPYKDHPQKPLFTVPIPRKAVARQGTHIEMDTDPLVLKVNFLPPAITLLAVLLLGLGLYLNLSTKVLITQEALEEKYGVRVTMIATSMMGNIVDIRLKIIDAEKAENLYYDHWLMPSLIIPGNGDFRILPPNIHKHSLIEGRTYSIFYPNLHQMVQPGTAVAILFGNMQLLPITTQ